MKRPKRKLKRISGLTWLQKLMIEGAIQFAIDRSVVEESGLEVGDLELSKGFQKLLATFRIKTKHMKAPRRRKRRSRK